MYIISEIIVCATLITFCQGAQDRLGPYATKEECENRLTVIREEIPQEFLRYFRMPMQPVEVSGGECVLNGVNS